MTLRLRPFETLVIASCLVALVLIGPLRGAVATFPFIPFAAAMVLLTAPGALLVRWFARELFPGVALIPAAVALGAGLYGLLGIPMLMMHRSLDLYLWLCGILLAAFLVAAGIRALSPPDECEVQHQDTRSTTGAWCLWLPFLLLGGALVFLAGLETPLVDGDTWNYLAWVREYLNTERLAFYDPYFGSLVPEFSRVQINGYILEQAALSRLSGVGPITLVTRLLSPTLVAVSLLACYALARLLFKSVGAALLAGCLYALFLLAHLEPLPSAFGGEFLVRAVQDKGFARFVFFPAALCFAVAFLERRQLRHLALFGFLCWAVVGIHPAGLAIIGLAVMGLGLLHAAKGWRRLPAWLGSAALGAALLSVLIVPLSYVLLTGHPLSSILYSADIGASNPIVLANQVFVREEWRKILVLDSGSYIMHPSLVLDPVIATGYVLGIPFLLWRLRGDASTAAQLLLGSLLIASAASYVPPIATFLGEAVVGAGQLHRLSWPIPLAVFLTLGWMGWEAIQWAAGKFWLPARAVPLLALGVVLALTIITPRVSSEVTKAYSYNQLSDISADKRNAGLIPVFRWMHENITEPAVVLAPDDENTVIPAYSAEANVLSFRGAPVMNNLADLERVSGKEIEVPQGARDVRAFYSSATPEGRLEILRRYKVDYVLALAKNPLAQALKEAPYLTQLETPGERYVLFAVDRAKLGLPT